MEMNWLVFFPKCGNKGKYLGYRVMLVDRKKGASQPENHVTLKEILEQPEFEKCYPHTIGYYKEASGEGAEFKPEYLEIRKVSTIEEFWLFLNALDI
jgi:hypothetical protein